MKNVLIKPLFTEKGNIAKEKNNKYIFQVHKDSNKIEIRKNIEDMFKVHVLDVNTSIMDGKKRRMGKYEGKMSDWKKAVVTLKSGEIIKLVEES